MPSLRHAAVLLSVIFWGMESGVTLVVDDNMIQIAKEHFQAKRITKITAFVCSGKYGRRLMRQLSYVGIQTHFGIPRNRMENPPTGTSKNINGRWWPVGILLDTSCFEQTEFLSKAHLHKMFDSLHFWLIFHSYAIPNRTIIHNESTVPCLNDLSILNETTHIFREVQMLVNSEVTLVIQRKDGLSNLVCLLDVYRIRVNDPLMVTPVAFQMSNPLVRSSLCESRKSAGSLVTANPENLTSEIIERECFLPNLPRDIQPTSLRRQNLQGVTLLAGTVITRPELFTGMHDMQLRHVDTWTKINYVLMEQMSHDLNFTLTLRFFDNWGYMTNGSFDGLVGSLEHHELDLGATGILIKADRLMVIDYVGNTYQFRATMIFLQPSLASITNIFLQPFNKQVWLCAGFMLIIDAMALLIQMKIEGKYILNMKSSVKKRKRHMKRKLDHIHWGDIIMMVVGAACQQGYYAPPLSLSARTTFLFLWLASLFLFTSYAANVVALLQTPSHSVTSLADLLNGPMEVGIEDVIYNHVYFQETSDPLAKMLFHKKIAPKHGKAFYTAAEGMKRVQKGLFAFQVEHNIGYKIISETFTEGEKCGLSDVQLLPTPVLGIPIVQGSPYKEILAQKLRPLREVGVLDRTFRQWVPQRPSCSHSPLSSSKQFISIGLKELHSSFSLLQNGIGISLLILLLECLIHKYHSTKKLFNSVK